MPPFIIALLGPLNFEFSRSANGGLKESELLQLRRDYDAFLGEKTTTVVPVKGRKMDLNISCKFLVKNRGKRPINCDPKLSLCCVTRASTCSCFLGH